MTFNIQCAHTELTELSKLVPNPRNANSHPASQIKRLAEIISFQGQRAPIVVSKRSGFIVKGHARLDAIKMLNWEKAAVDFQDYESDAQEWADIIADNEIARWAELDVQKLNIDLKQFPELKIEMLGLEDLSIIENDAGGLTDPDDVPEVPENPVSRLGDLWVLGEHRLLCGDCTVKENIDLLMNGEKADMVFTDPPYGVAVENGQGKIIGDEDLNVFKSCLPILKISAKGDAHFYVWCASGDRMPESIWEFSKNINFQNLLPIRVTHENKRGPKAAFKYNYEACLFGNDNTRPFNSSDKFKVSSTTLSDNRYQGDGKLKVFPALWDGARSTEHNMNIVHPTQKKVEMVEFYVGISSDHGDVILDTFLGSGTTLVACEKTNRKCFGMEIDQHYADVIVTRFQNFTGKLATLGGKTFEQIKAERCASQST